MVKLYTLYSKLLVVCHELYTSALSKLYNMLFCGSPVHGYGLDFHLQFYGVSPVELQHELVLCIYID